MLRRKVYHALPDQVPEYMRDMLQERTNVRTSYSTVSSQLEDHQSRLKGFGNRAFNIATPRLWNALLSLIVNLLVL